MNAKHIGKPLFTTLAAVAVIAALVFPMQLSQAAGGTSFPFIGHWQAIDVDGSDIRLTIAGPPSGPFQITWTESYISFCGGEAGIVRGTGVLDEMDGNVLEADLHVACFTTGESLDFHLTFRFQPLTGRLSAGYENGFVTVWNRPGQVPPPPDLGLRVNYGHDWVESFYEAGHMVWVTVTESDGVTVKATAEVVTEPKDFWSGETGFQTNPEDWDSEPPDIQPYDWVYAWVDNGASAQVQIGDILGSIDLSADSVNGTINAPWFSSEVEVECHPWGAPSPVDMKYDTVQPDGSDTYACSWSGEWNILPYQDVGVGYFGADGHWVANAFYVAAPRIVASETGDWFWTSDFNPGYLDLAIYEFESDGIGQNLLWSGQQEADEWGFTFVGDDVHGQDLGPGNYVVVSDGVNTKGLLLMPIAVTMFDTQYDFMAGFAPEGSEVWAAAGPMEWQERILVSADSESGAWFADFKTIEFDITEDMQPWSYAHIYDDDGDANEGSVPPLELWVAALTYDLPAGSLTDNGVYPYHFELGWDFPAPGAFSGQEGELDISGGAQIYDGHVLLRGQSELRGISSLEGLSCEEVVQINPNQPMRFLIGWLPDYGMTYPEALAYFESLTGRVVWGDGMSAELTRHEVLPFSFDDLAAWFNYVCTFTAQE